MFKKSEESRIHLRYRVLAAAVFSTLAGAGLTQASLLPASPEHGVPVGSIGYIGPVPAQPATVATGNTFDIAVVGLDITFSSTGVPSENDIGYLVGPFTPTFGTTLTAAKATSDGETATVTSTETAANGITTDTVKLSVPTRFVPVGTKFSDGDVINDEDLEIGFSAGTKALTFSVPVTTAITASGTAVYKVNGTAGTYTFSAAKGSAPYTYLDPTGEMLSADEGLNNFTDSTGETAADLTAYNLSSFSFTFSYATPAAVPEPGTAAVGLILGAGLLRRRTRRSGVASSVVDLSTGLVDEPIAPSDSCQSSAVAPVDAGNGSIGENQLI